MVGFLPVIALVLGRLFPMAPDIADEELLAATRVAKSGFTDVEAFDSGVTATLLL